MGCPLPVDWLDWLEDPAELPGLSAHLDVCASCRAVVAALQQRLDLPLLGSDLERAPASPVFEEAVGGHPAAGEIWITVAPDETRDRALVLVVGDRLSQYGRDWYEVVGIDTDVERAAEIDVLLERDETTIRTPLRVRFELQGYVAGSDLHERVGALAGPGRNVIAAAFDGSLDESRWGIPLEGAHDQRLMGDDAGAHSIRQLQLLYRTYAAAAEDPELSLARAIRDVRTARRLTRVQVATDLAEGLGVASLTAKVKRYYADLESGLLDPRGLARRVVSELARILAVPPQQLEGLRDTWTATAMDDAPVFARTTADVALTPALQAREEWDEVDELFRGESR